MGGASVLRISRPKSVPVFTSARGVVRACPSTAYRIRRMLRRGEMSALEIRLRLGMTKYASGMALHRLVAAKEVDRLRIGVYRLAKREAQG